MLDVPEKKLWYHRGIFLGVLLGTSISLMAHSVSTAIMRYRGRSSSTFDVELVPEIPPKDHKLHEWESQKEIDGWNREDHDIESQMGLHRKEGEP